MLIGLSYIHCPLHLHQHHDASTSTPSDPKIRATLPWTPAAARYLRWGRSGAGGQRVLTPAARWGRQDERSDEPWSGSERRSSAREIWALDPGGKCQSVLRLDGCDHSPRVWFTLHLSAAASCFTFHPSWLKAWPEFMFPLPPSLPPPCAWKLPRPAGEWKQLQDYWCHGGKNVFCGAVWRCSRSFAFRRGYSRTPPNLSQETWFLISQSSMGRCGQGWRLAELHIVDCWPVELQGWLFLSCRPICMWMVQL